MSDNQHARRTFAVFVNGDSADEIELAALARAREFFGSGVALAIRPNYRARTVDAHEDTGGKAYRARVEVQEAS